MPSVRDGAGRAAFAALASVALLLAAAPPVAVAGEAAPVYTFVRRAGLNHPAVSTLEKRMYSFIGSMADDGVRSAAASLKGTASPGSIAKNAVKALDDEISSEARASLVRQRLMKAGPPQYPSLSTVPSVSPPRRPPPPVPASPPSVSPPRRPPPPVPATVPSGPRRPTLLRTDAFAKNTAVKAVDDEVAAEQARAALARQRRVPPAPVKLPPTMEEVIATVNKAKLKEAQDGTIEEAARRAAQFWFPTR